MNEKQGSDDAAQVLVAAGAAYGICAAGAQPSITAPANSIRPYQHGVDSLYLSFQGSIHLKLATDLHEVKLLAQSDDESVSVQGGVTIDDHRFVVLPHGRRRFAFVLEDNWFSIQLSDASANTLPLALVQIRSEYLTAVGPDEAIAIITRLIGRMGKVSEPAKISRIDLFVDFSTDHALASVPGSHWIKRSKKRAIYEECDQITGISFGSGEVSAAVRQDARDSKIGQRLHAAIVGNARLERCFASLAHGIPDSPRGITRGSTRLYRTCAVEQWTPLALPVR